MNNKTKNICIVVACVGILGFAGATFLTISGTKKIVKDKVEAIGNKVEGKIENASTVVKEDYSKAKTVAKSASDKVKQKFGKLTN